jgi:hypothetical protein
MFSQKILKYIFIFLRDNEEVGGWEVGGWQSLSSGFAITYK